MLCGNFRVQGLPFDASAIAEVGLPTLRGQPSSGESRLPTKGYASINAGELTLRLLSRSADAALSWVHKTVADGQLDAPEFLDLTVELLDATLKNVRAVLRLTGCGLLACDEARIDSRSETPGSVTLRFAVEAVDLMFSGA